MRKLTFAINLTLDGCCDHTKGIADEEVHQFFSRLLGEGDTLLYGRKTYELMVPFWPDMAKANSGDTKELNDFAHAFDAMKKIVVFSRSLEKGYDKRTQIVRGNLKEEVLKLKNEEGSNILAGGVDIPGQLIELGLVDEYCFVIQPIVVGAGRRFFGDSPWKDKLKLVDTEVFKSGCVALRYINK